MEKKLNDDLYVLRSRS